MSCIRESVDGIIDLIGQLSRDVIGRLLAQKTRNVIGAFRFLQNNKNEENNKCKGGFSVSRNVYVRTRVHKIEALYGSSRVDPKVERGSTFSYLTRDIPYTASFYFILTCVRT